jgi:perosamine synthetase
MELDELTIQHDSPLREAMACMDANAQGICFVLDGKRLAGILTDGDVRRAVMHGAALDNAVSQVMVKNCKSLPVDTPEPEIRRNLNHRIRHIPLVNQADELVDYASLWRNHRIPVMEPQLNGNELEYVTECIRTNWVSSQGRFVKIFEEQFEDYTTQPHAVSTSSGTTALHLALMALEIGVGDEVILPDLTFAATINAVLYTGATPVLVDVDPENWTMNPDAVSQAITSNTKALIPVHLYGHPCDMASLLSIAADHNLLLVEDCAQALGSEYQGQSMGSFGDAAMFSFFGNKTITTGEGGMAVFRDTRVADRAKLLRDHGMAKDRRYWHPVIGYNYRMTNLQAALGVAQMERVQDLVNSKRELAGLYRDQLGPIDWIQLPAEADWAANSYWLYTVILKKDAPISRDELIREFQDMGVETRPMFYPLHEMPPYVQVRRIGDLSVTSRLAKSGISLPSSPGTRIEDVSRTAEVLSELRTITIQ